MNTSTSRADEKPRASTWLAASQGSEGEAAPSAADERGEQPAEVRDGEVELDLLADRNGSAGRGGRRNGNGPSVCAHRTFDRLERSVLGSPFLDHARPGLEHGGDRGLGDLGRRDDA